VIKRLAELTDAAYGLGLSGKLIGSSARTYRRDSLARWRIDPHTLRTYGCRACGVWVTEGIPGAISSKILPLCGNGLVCGK